MEANGSDFAAICCRLLHARFAHWLQPGLGFASHGGSVMKERRLTETAPARRGMSA